VAFGEHLALDRVDLTVEPAEIRALMGANGSGKSSFVKVLAGLYRPMAQARIRVAGQDLALGVVGPADELGLRFVHQDLGLVETLDTVDNLAMGHGYRHRRAGMIAWRQEARSAASALEALGYEIDVRRPVGELTASERTAIAVARALSPRRTTARMLVLDEPTANLPAAEANRLFDLIRRVRDSGTAILFISHHLAEIFAIADSVTVLRDGRLVTTQPTSSLSEDELVTHVIGRELARELEHHQGPAEDAGEALSVRGLQARVLAGIDLTVKKGEIVGVAGITGSGREELAGALFGDIPRSGEVRVGQRPVRDQRPDISMKMGLVLVPADRRQNAAFMEGSLRENITVIDTSANTVKGFISARKERREVNGWLQKLSVVPRRSEARLETLSGGNQQKVMLARCLRQTPKVLILDDPTQGVDVGSKAEIHRLIRKAAHDGTAVLVISTDDEELVGLCARVVVLREGAIRDELTAAELTIERLTGSTVGVQRTVQ
jgi:ribose transport system ATP-binding protein